jgi:hypothetical protein
VYSGTHIENYRQRLNQLAGIELHFIGGYIATEAPMGWNVEDKGEFEFNLASMLFSFTDLDCQLGGTLGIHELEVGGRYKVNIGTPNGLLQYAMKDVVRITSVEPRVRFEIVGREDTAINVAMEKVSHNAINKVLEQVQKDLDRTIDHFFLCPGVSDNGAPCYEWTFVMDDNQLMESAAIALMVDGHLQSQSDDYKECRLDGGTIGSPRVNFLPRAITQDYFRLFQEKGQLKMKSILPNKASLVDLIRQVSPNHLPLLG